IASGSVTWRPCSCASWLPRLIRLCCPYSVALGIVWSISACASFAHSVVRWSFLGCSVICGGSFAVVLHVRVFLVLVLCFRWWWPSSLWFLCLVRFWLLGPSALVCFAVVRWLVVLAFCVFRGLFCRPLSVRCVQFLIVALRLWLLVRPVCLGDVVFW